LRKQASSSFFEKKEPKKLLSAWRPLRRNTRRRRMGETHRLSPSPNEPSGLKLPHLAANRSQTDKSFFGSFFSKKELLAFPLLPAACLKK
jgi:hypothetical protein